MGVPGVLCGVLRQLRHGGWRVLELRCSVICRRAMEGVWGDVRFNFQKRFVADMKSVRKCRTIHAERRDDCNHNRKVMQSPDFHPDRSPSSGGVVDVYSAVVMTSKHRSKAVLRVDPTDHLVSERVRPAFLGIDDQSFRLHLKSGRRRRSQPHFDCFLTRDDAVEFVRLTLLFWCLRPDTIPAVVSKAKKKPCNRHLQKQGIRPSLG